MELSWQLHGFYLSRSMSLMIQRKWLLSLASILFFSPAIVSAATIGIDSFNDGDQIVADGTPNSAIATAAAIGGTRVLSMPAGSIGGVAAVDSATGVFGVLNADANPYAVQVIYLDGGVLGGVDLTDGGTNDRFAVDFVDLVSVGATDSLLLSVVDSMGNVNTGVATFDMITAGTFLLPFSSTVPIVGGGADFSAIDVITAQVTLVTPLSAVTIGDIRAIPEPSSLLICGLLAIGAYLWTAGRR
jgi:hypothetical protein